MKTGIIFSGVVITITSLAFASCEWLASKDKPLSQQASLIGKWVIVNIADSSKNSTNGVGLLALALASKDSAQLTVEFKPDSNFVMLKDTGKYYIDSTSHTLFIKEDSTDLPLTIKQQTDSTLELFSTTDSVWYILQKNK